MLPNAKIIRHIVGLLLFVSIASCSTVSTLPTDAGYGEAPVLPAPRHSLIPLVNTADADPWRQGSGPTAAAGFSVNEFAGGLDHPRWLYVLPNGDVLVAESDAPKKPDDSKGIRGWFMKKIMKGAGSGLPSANRIRLLRDQNGDGVAETRSTLITGLNSPFGMTLVGNDLFVADTDALLRFPYSGGESSITQAPTMVLNLPAGRINHHWTKNVIASADGKQLFVTIGSNSNAGENGIAQEDGRARIIVIDTQTGEARDYATGLRNPNGMAWQPQSGRLWVAVNERDELGNDLVPDYMTAVIDGTFYGWPYSYYGDHVDERAKPPNPDLVAKAIVPDYALGAHTASLGLAFCAHCAFPAKYDGGAFVGQHGSWNRDPRSGYKVIFVPFSQGAPSGPPEDVLTGFLDARGDARGRPVGVVFDRAGDLLVADDVGGKVWRVSYKGADRPRTSAR